MKTRLRSWLLAAALLAGVPIASPGSDVRYIHKNINVYTQTNSPATNTLKWGTPWVTPGFSVTTVTNAVLLDRFNYFTQYAWYHSSTTNKVYEEWTDIVLCDPDNTPYRRDYTHYPGDDWYNRYHADWLHRRYSIANLDDVESRLDSNKSFSAVYLDEDYGTNGVTTTNTHTSPNYVYQTHASCPEVAYEETVDLTWAHWDYNATNAGNYTDDIWDENNGERYEYKVEQTPMLRLLKRPTFEWVPSQKGLPRRMGGRSGRMENVRRIWLKVAVTTAFGDVVPSDHVYLNYLWRYIPTNIPVETVANGGYPYNERPLATNKIYGSPQSVTNLFLGNPTYCYFRLELPEPSADSIKQGDDVVHDGQTYGYAFPLDVRVDNTVGCHTSGHNCSAVDTKNYKVVLLDVYDDEDPNLLWELQCLKINTTTPVQYVDPPLPNITDANYPNRPQGGTDPWPWIDWSWWQALRDLNEEDYATWVWENIDGKFYDLFLDPVDYTKDGWPYHFDYTIPRPWPGPHHPLPHPRPPSEMWYSRDRAPRAYEGDEHSNVTAPDRRNWTGLSGILYVKDTSTSADNQVPYYFRDPANHLGAGTNWMMMTNPFVRVPGTGTVTIQVRADVPASEVVSFSVPAGDVTYPFILQKWSELPGILYPVACTDEYYSPATDAQLFYRDPANHLGAGTNWMILTNTFIWVPEGSGTTDIEVSTGLPGETATTFTVAEGPTPCPVPVAYWNYDGTGFAGSSPSWGIVTEDPLVYCGYAYIGYPSTGDAPPWYSIQWRWDSNSQWQPWYGYQYLGEQGGSWTPVNLEFRGVSNDSTNFPWSSVASDNF